MTEPAEVPEPITVTDDMVNAALDKFSRWAPRLIAPAKRWRERDVNAMREALKAGFAARVIVSTAVDSGEQTP